MSYPKCEIPKENCLIRDENGICKIRTICQKIVDKCVGCSRVDNGYCSVYVNPEAKWRVNGPDAICPMASHVQKEVPEAEKVRIGQQKQRKAKTRK